MLEFSSNAASAKVRGRFGKRLSSEDYRLMCGCRTVDELAVFLRSTAYGEHMDRGVMHREQIEEAVGLRLYSELDGLKRYLGEDGGYLNGYFTGRYEIAEIVKAATRLSGASTPEKTDSGRFRKFAADSDVKLYILAVARRREDIATAVEGTPHESVCREFLNSEAMTVPQLEAKLWGGLYGRIIASAERHTHGQELENIKQLFSQRIDVMNYVTVCRMKRYDGVTPDYLHSLIIPGGTLSEKIIDKMICAGTEDELYTTVRKTHIGRMADAEGLNAFNVPVKEYIKFIHYCKYPAVVVAAYLFYLENEAANVIKITEGIRYSLDRGAIYGLLTVAE